MQNLECENIIHLSGFKKVTAPVAENEWEGFCFVVSDASTTTRKFSIWSQVNSKEGCHGKLMVQYWKAVIIDWLHKRGN